MNALITGVLLFLTSLEKYMRSTLKKMLQNSQTVRAVSTVAIQTKLSFSNKFSRNLGSRPKMSIHVSSTWRILRPGSFWKALGSVAGNGVDGRLLLVVMSMYSYSDVCVRVGGVKSHPFTVGVGFWQWYVLSPLLFIVYMNCWEMKDQPFTLCGRFGTASIFSTESPACTRSFFCCVRPGRKETQH